VTAAALLVLLPLLPRVDAEGGEGVPAAWVERARVFLAEALSEAGARDDARVGLVLHRDAAGLERALAGAKARSPERPGAGYAPATRTVHAWCVPLPEPALFADGLPGLLQGALAHEARHAAAHLAEGYLRVVPFAEVEGAADVGAIAWLAGRADPAAGAWQWMLASRVARAREQDLFAAPEAFATMVPAHLDPSRRAVWYAQAWVAARGADPALPEWLLWEGFGEPRADGFRLVAAAGGGAAMLVRREPGPVDLTLTPLPFGSPAIVVLADFRSESDHVAVRIACDGTVTVTRGGGPGDGVVREAGRARFPLRVELAEGVLRLGGEAVLGTTGRFGIAVEGEAPAGDAAAGPSAAGDSAAGDSAAGPSAAGNPAGCGVDVRVVRDAS